MFGWVSGMIPFRSHCHGHTNSDMKNIDNNITITRTMIIAILKQQLPKTKQTMHTHKQKLIQQHRRQEKVKSLIKK